MRYNQQKDRAARYIRQEKGFECPTCHSYVPAGRDVCYNCGDMPAIYSSSHDGACFGILLFIASLFFAPFNFFMTTLVNNDGYYALHYIFLIPNLLMFLYCIITLVRRSFYSGCLSVITRLWIILCSGAALFNFISVIHLM